MATTFTTRANRNASYRDIGGPDGHLAARRPFVGNSMSAILMPIYGGEGRPGEREQVGEQYIVSSYETVIAEWRSGEGARMVNDRYYSPTTSRHQNLCREWLLND